MYQIIYQNINEMQKHVETDYKCLIWLINLKTHPHIYITCIYLTIQCRSVYKMIYLQNYSFNDAYIKHQSSHYFEKCYKCNSINSTDVAHLIPYVIRN